MMPVIRIPDDTFRRLQGLATPLVDTPASVIDKLLDFHESNGGTPPAPSLSNSATEGDSPLTAASGSEAFETYENRNNPHVTIHRVGCSQLRKRGGVHRHGQGSYKSHGAVAEAQRYAASTGLPVKLCSYCNPTREE
jgi:hypothetical protein